MIWQCGGKSVSVNRGNIERYCIAPRFLMMRWALAVLGRRNEQWVLNIGPLHLEEKHLQFVRNVFSILSNSTFFCICCVCDLDLAHGWTLQRYPGSEVVPPSHRWENVSSWGFGLDKCQKKWTFYGQADRKHLSPPPLLTVSLTVKRSLFDDFPNSLGKLKMAPTWEDEHVPELVAVPVNVHAASPTTTDQFLKKRWWWKHW